jgi:NADPH-dependent 2,4-dienoyl-CoA reductase/sulfur reductase-like enzyme
MGCTQSSSTTGTNGGGGGGTDATAGTNGALPANAEDEGIDKYRVIVVGFGVAAGYFCAELSNLGLGPFEVAVIGDEPVVAYERPALSKGYLFAPHYPNSPPVRLPGFHTCKGEGKEVHDADWYESKQWTAYRSTRVVEVDLKNKLVKTKGASGNDAMRYEKLVIATGTRERILDVPGKELRGIYYLKKEEHANALVKRLEKIFGVKALDPVITSPNLSNTNKATAQKLRGSNQNDGLAGLGKASSQVILHGSSGITSSLPSSSSGAAGGDNSPSIRSSQQGKSNVLNSPGSGIGGIHTTSPSGGGGGGGGNNRGSKTINVQPMDNEQLSKTTVTIIGGGYLTTELMSAMYGWGFDEINIILRDDRLMSHMAWPKFLGENLEAALLERIGNKVKIYAMRNVKAFKPLSEESNMVGKVILDDDTVLESDLVIVAIGTIPNGDELFKGKLDLGKDGSLVVDKTLRTSHKSRDVWAIGECAFHDCGVDQSRKMGVYAAKSVYNALLMETEAEPFDVKRYHYSRLFDYDQPIVWHQYSYQGNNKGMKICALGKNNPVQAGFGAYWVNETTKKVVSAMFCNTGMDLDIFKVLKQAVVEEVAEEVLEDKMRVKGLFE